jgi:hypothetical protein
LWSLCLFTLFGVAWSLTPDPRGLGTHQQLGLPPCSLRLLTGRLCPSCGATTAFAHFVRGEWSSGFRANPAAFLLAGLCALQLPLCGWMIVQGRWPAAANSERMVLGVLLGLTAAFVVQGVFRMM